MTDIVYTLDECAGMLKVSVATIRRLINDGELKAIKIRNQLRIRKEDWDDYLRRR
jgi:excisionase family DNA binding protein